MAHGKWCGDECLHCSAPCDTRVDLGCFPNCRAVRRDGTISGSMCKGSGCILFGNTEGECPVCGKDMPLETESVPEEGESLYERWTCSCGARITTTYCLRFDRHGLDNPAPAREKMEDVHAHV